jgi:hypothetical protein
VRACVHVGTRVRGRLHARVAVDARLRPLGHWKRLHAQLFGLNTLWSIYCAECELHSSQELTPGPYSEKEESSPTFTTYSLKIHLNIIFIFIQIFHVASYLYNFRIYFSQELLYFRLICVLRVSPTSSDYVRMFAVNSWLACWEACFWPYDKTNDFKCIN